MTIDAISQTLSQAIGSERAGSLLKRLRNYSNQPNAVRGVSKFASDPAAESAAVGIFRDSTSSAVESLDIKSLAAMHDSITMWGLLALAARADLTVLDLLPDELAERAAPKIAAIKRGVKKHQAELAAPAPVVAPDAVVLPTSLAKVAAWLRENPDADPALFAPAPKQKLAARKVAIRALGLIGSPAAFEVLTGYASDDYALPELAELHRAWGRFDRRAFAATMFRPNSWRLNLDTCSHLEGIGAVAGLTSLEAILDGPTDLEPLRECTELQRLLLRITDDFAMTNFDAVASLPALTDLTLDGINTSLDLTILAQAPVRRLVVSLHGATAEFLLRMPALERVELRAGTHPAPGLSDVVTKLVAAGVAVSISRYEAWFTEWLAIAETDESISIDPSRYGVTLSRSA